LSCRSMTLLPEFREIVDVAREPTTNDKLELFKLFCLIFELVATAKTVFTEFSRRPGCGVANSDIKIEVVGGK